MAKLPIKRVTIFEKDHFRLPGRGGEPKVFGAMSAAVRQRVAGEVSTIRARFSESFRIYPRTAAVARLVLKSEALAKSHRPVDILERSGCPIIGIGGLGELLVSVKASTLPQLEHSVLYETSRKAEANISTISRIEAYDLDEERVAELESKLRHGQTTAVKLRVFRHGDADVDGALDRVLDDQLKSLQIAYEPLHYSSSMRILRLLDVRPDHVRPLARYVGTQSLGFFPEYRVVRPSAQPIRKLTASDLPAPEPGMHYPIVGLIDTGIDPATSLLSPWVVARDESYVPASDRDYEHGTFVAGLIVHSRALNHDDPSFPACACKLVDVVAIPKSGTVTEDELVALLREVVPKYPEVRVWNMSLAGNEPCTDHAFSDFAVALDDIQTTYGVIFVLPSGNYNVTPFRGWPPDKMLGEADRICAPSDSARALTVGSVAHRDATGSRVPRDAPSPFSRRGPGPVYLPKPEVCHYGGNCDSHGRFDQVGVLSADAQGQLAESIGTSFAAPIVSSIVAHVQEQPAEQLSNLMAKALVVHSAILSGKPIPSQELNYRGFGTPLDASDVLACEPWSATLIFETEMEAGVDIEREPFPLPACLRSAESFRGDMTITLAYEPPLDGTFGAEYCRSNVDVSLGTYEPGPDGKPKQLGQVPSFPKRAGAMAEERKLIEQGLKWSPIKVYRRSANRGV